MTAPRSGSAPAPAGARTPGASVARCSHAGPGVSALPSRPRPAPARPVTTATNSVLQWPWRPAALTGAAGPEAFAAPAPLTLWLSCAARAESVTCLRMIPVAAAILAGTAGPLVPPVHLRADNPRTRALHTAASLGTSPTQAKPQADFRPTHTLHHPTTDPWLIAEHPAGRSALPAVSATASLCRAVPAGAAWHALLPPRLPTPVPASPGMSNGHHALEITECADRVSVRVTASAPRESPGLDREEAARRLADDGPNALPAPKDRPEVVKCMCKMADPFLAMLLGAAILSVVPAAVGADDDPTNLYLAGETHQLLRFARVRALGCPWEPWVPWQRARNNHADISRSLPVPLSFAHFVGPRVPTSPQPPSRGSSRSTRSSPTPRRRPAQR